MSKPVTERDFRKPEYLDANPEDYEFDSSGNIVRKDRWETAVKRIAKAFNLSVNDSNFNETVDAVIAASAHFKDWTFVHKEEEADLLPMLLPPIDATIDVKLQDGSILTGLTYSRRVSLWMWHDTAIPLFSAWREHPK